MDITPSNRLAKLSQYPFAEIIQAVQALKDQGIEPIDFGVGDPSEPTPEFVRETVAAAAQKEAATGYPSYIGSKAFREAASRYMQKRFNVELDPEMEICSSIGSKEAVFHFAEGFINPGDIVIMPSPGYPPMKTGTLFAEGVPYFVPLLEKNNFLLDYQSIPENIAEKAKILWINYPNSPTGAVADRKYYEGLVEWAHQHNIIIAADEGCYIDIYFDEKPSSILEISKVGIVTFYSLSKRNNMTGYRVGFVAGDQKIIDIYKKLKTHMDSGTPNIMQDAAIVALDDDLHNQSMRELYRQKQTILLKALKKIGLETRTSKGTFYIWQKVPNGMTSVEFAKKLLQPEIAIVVTPGSLISDICANGSNPGEGYVRFALMPTVAEIEKAASRLQQHYH